VYVEARGGVTLKYSVSRRLGPLKGTKGNMKGEWELGTRHVLWEQGGRGRGTREESLLTPWTDSKRTIGKCQVRTQLAEVRSKKARSLTSRKKGGIGVNKDLIYLRAASEKFGTGGRAGKSAPKKKNRSGAKEAAVPSLET